VWRYNVRAFDPAGGAIAYSLDQAPAGARIDAVTGFVQWTATPGRHPLRVTATRPDGRSASQSLVIEAQ
jgi:hypothetical protein